MPEGVVIERPRPEWSGRFAALRERLAAALGETAAAIEHVGSTAVPGLAAKPVVDMDVVVRAPADVPRAAARLAAAGYVAEGDLGVAGREAFASPPGWAAHHLYVCARGAAELSRHLAFRDHLRGAPAAARAYAALKEAAAKTHGADRAAYTQAKSAFIADALRVAPRPRTLPRPQQ